MKIIGAVILYYPDENVWNNISSYYDYVDHLIVVDNSENIQDKNKGKIEQYRKCIYLSCNQNLGISKGLNIAAKKAIELNGDWLLCMDQDSKFIDLDIKQFFLCLRQTEEGDRIGLIGPVYNNAITNSYATECKFTDVSHLITSGSLVNLAVFTKIGPFDEQLFIDGVDIEYSYRLRINNYRVCIAENIFLVHELGSKFVLKTFFTNKQVVRHMHSPQRIYYMVRNFLYISKKYKNQFRDDLKKIRKSIFVDIKNSFLYSGRPFKTLQMTCKGFIHFYKKRYGPYF